jgi:hypothetical protein
MVPDPAPPFEVGMSQLLHEQIGQPFDLAHARGIGETFDATVVRILEKLRMSPRESGDPIRNLRGLHMVQYRIYFGGLVANYSVHDRIPMVALWSLGPDPHHPLYPPPPNGD